MINLHRFDLLTLRLYVAVVDAGSLTAGSRTLGLSLAAASKRVAELEQHCGVTLLVRSKRGVTPTPAGQSMYHHAVDVVARLEHLALAMDDFRSGATGQLRLWANNSAFAGFLPGCWPTSWRPTRVCRWTWKTRSARNPCAPCSAAWPSWPSSGRTRPWKG